MFRVLRTALAASLCALSSAIVLPAWAGDPVVRAPVSVKVHGRIRNPNHWVMRRARHGLYGHASRWHGPIVNPIAGTRRHRWNGVTRINVPFDDHRNAALEIAGTAFPTKPASKVIKVSDEAVELAEDRAAGRVERFEAQNVEIRFHTPRQAYDVRFPNVIYLDSR